MVCPIPIGRDFEKTLELGKVSSTTIELWLTKNAAATEKACDIFIQWPGFSFSWSTIWSKSKGNSHSFDVSKNAQEMFDGDGTHYKVYQMKKYLDFADGEVKVYEIRKQTKHKQCRNLD